MTDERAGDARGRLRSAGNPRVTTPLQPGHLGWAHVLLGAAAAIACALVLPSLLMMGITGGLVGGGGEGLGGAEGLGGPEGLGGSGVDVLDPAALRAPAWMSPLQFTVLAVVSAWILRRARRKAGKRGSLAEGRESDARGGAIGPGTATGRGFSTLRAPLIVGAAAVAFAVAANLLMDAPGIESPHAIVNQLGLGSAAWSDALIIAGVAVAAPVGEELALRGLVFRGAYDAVARARAKRRAPGGTSSGSSASGSSAPGGTALPFLRPFLFAAVLSAAVFAALHMNPAVAQNVFFVCLGLGAATAFWLTGILASAVWVHSLVNAIGLAFAMFVATGVGSAWHAVALAAAPFLALLLMGPVGRIAGGGRA